MATSEGLPRAARVFRRRPLPEGGLYRLSRLTWPENHSAVARNLASAAVLVCVVCY